MFKMREISLCGSEGMNARKYLLLRRFGGQQWHSGNRNQIGVSGGEEMATLQRRVAVWEERSQQLVGRQG
jgi:hypothetical protein